jgi:hypothetical protein
MIWAFVLDSPESVYVSPYRSAYARLYGRDPGTIESSGRIPQVCRAIYAGMAVMVYQ